MNTGGAGAHDHGAAVWLWVRRPERFRGRVISVAEIRSDR
jgi:hypothetical protein